MSQSPVLLALEQLLTTLLATYGPYGTLGIAAGVVLCVMGSYRYHDWRKLRDLRALQDALATTNRQLTRELRLWQVLGLMQRGWTPEETDAVLWPPEGAPPDLLSAAIPLSAGPDTRHPPPTPAPAPEAGGRP